MKNLIYILLVLTAFSCYERQDGCLDPFATNYDIAADDGCSDCCKYPALTLSIGHYNGAVSLAQNDTILTASDSLLLLDFVYTISNVKLSENDSLVSIIDTTTLSNNETITDDIVKIKDSGYSNNIGTFRYEGELSQLDFSIGLPPILESQYLLNDRHSVNNSNDSLRQDGIYYQQRIQIARGYQFKDTILINIPATTGQNPIKIALNTASEKAKGLNIELKADYAKWFEGVDISQNPTAIGNQILNNQNDFIIK